MVTFAYQFVSLINYFLPFRFRYPANIGSCGGGLAARIVGAHTPAAAARGDRPRYRLLVGPATAAGSRAGAVREPALSRGAVPLHLGDLAQTLIRGFNFFRGIFFVCVFLTLIMMMDFISRFYLSSTPKKTNFVVS